MSMSPETVVLSVAMAVAAGLVGCFAVMRRMALSADALSHVALPGIGVAMALHIHPLAGAVAMLFFGALLVWALDNRARLATETIIGVVFSAALAVGSMIASGEDLIEALFGGGGALSRLEIAFGLIAATAVVSFILKEKHALVLALVSPDIARTAGVNLRRLNLLYLQMLRSRSRSACAISAYSSWVRSSSSRPPHRNASRRTSTRCSPWPSELQ